MKRYDLIIVGGGVAGAGLAAALRDLNLSIALIDARVPTLEDPRLFALNHGSCHFLKHTGIWAAIEKYAAPIKQVHVSQRARFGAVRLRADDVALAALGYVIPACQIEMALNDILLNSTNITLYQPATLLSLTQENGIAALRIDQEGEVISLHASLVIGADGTTSTVRNEVGIDAKIIDYGQSAIVTQTTLQRSHQSIAYERFTQHGAIAMLPLAEKKCATIWTVDQHIAAELMTLSDDDFLQRLQTTFGYRLGRFMGIAKRYTFPLRMVEAVSNTSGCVLLLGNAAHTIHPIAAQGFNLALYEVAVMVETIQQKLTEQLPLTAINLQQLAQQTYKQQSFSVGVSHRLSQLFKHTSPWASILTQLGMTGLDALPPLKKKFIGSILGRTGSVPRLLLDKMDYEKHF